MDSHEEHKPESLKPRRGLRFLVGIIAVALIAFVVIKPLMHWLRELSVFPAVDSIQEMTLISVDGMFEFGWREVELSNLPEEEKFHGFPILGAVEITDRSDRKAIISSITTGIYEADGVAMCFWPRHGLRIVTADATYEYNICFECLQYEVYKDFEASRFKWGMISSSPQEFLNTFFRKAGVPLAPSLEEVRRMQKQEGEESQPVTDDE